MEAAYQQIRDSLAEGKRVTLWSVPESVLTSTDGLPVPKDGLVDNHLYTVEGIHKDASGEVIVSVRNPWGNNNDVDGYVGDRAAVIDVPLSKIVTSRGLQQFDIVKLPQGAQDMIAKIESLAPELAGIRAGQLTLAAQRDLRPPDMTQAKTVEVASPRALA